MKQQNALGFWWWLGVIILVGLLIFKWIPAWTWRPKAPEIEISTKGFFFDTPATWSGETATIKQTTAHDIYILISPESAIDERAHLEVSLDGATIQQNCNYDNKKFCYILSASNVKDGDSHQIAAKNDAGEKRATMKIAITPEEKKSSSSSSSSSGSSSSSSSNDSSNSSGSSSSSNGSAGSTTSPVPYIRSTSCLHYEAGRCWDEYEDEMYSSGLYDQAYGYYGGSYTYPDDCDSRCQDILEDAYEEGYYDSY